jgi:hypothetical protein
MDPGFLPDSMVSTVQTYPPERTHAHQVSSVRTYPPEAFGGGLRFQTAQDQVKDFLSAPIRLFRDRQ